MGTWNLYLGRSFSAHQFCQTEELYQRGAMLLYASGRRDSASYFTSNLFISYLQPSNRLLHIYLH
jgi:hypothetical protein